MGDIDLKLGGENTISLKFLNNSGLKLVVGTSGAGSTTWTGLLDTPSEIEPLKFVRGNAAGDSLEQVESSASVSWGAINGTLSNQADLQAELDLKADEADLISHTSNINNPHTTTIDNLDNTTITSPTDNALLQYDSGTGKWIDVDFLTLEATINHNNISNLQGGNGTDEFYHLNAQDHSDLTDFNAQLAELQTDGSPTFDTPTLNAIQLNAFIPTPAHKRGLIFYDNDNECPAYYNEVAEVTNQIGQEIWVRVKNNSGVIIPNGRVVQVLTTDATLGIPAVNMAQANTALGSRNILGISTHEIGIGEVGYITTQGLVRGLDTSGLDLGKGIYLSPTILGEIQTDIPIYPDFRILVGGVASKDAITGSVFVKIIGRLQDYLVNLSVGTILETFFFDITATGGVITGSLERVGGGDLTAGFSTGLVPLDTTPPLTIILPAGTDNVPQSLFVYIPEDTKVLTVSTSDWPITEHIKISEVVVKSATFVENVGPTVNHNRNDHVADLTNKIGHIVHIADRLRQEFPKHKSGTEGNSSVDTGPTPNDVWVTCTGGKVWQLHLQDFDSKDTETGDVFQVVNHFTNPYEAQSNLNTQLDDALGNTLANTSFSVVLWGTINSGDTEGHLMINLPTGSYGRLSPDDAVADAENKSVYDFPAPYARTGFLIARLTYQLDNLGQNWVLHDVQPLTGKTPNSTAGGGGAGGGGVTTFTGLTDTPASYSGQALKTVRVNAGETALEFGAAGAVDSVFGRTGAVVAVADDYDASEVTNAFDKTADDADDVDDTSSINKFTTAGDISKLAGIEALAEVNNITDINATDLTDGNDTTLHIHDADRARANHTGTQTASTISDFESSVSANTDVAANTTHRGSDGKNHSDVVTNNAKVTNATHTGEVTGSTALTLDKTSVTGQSVVTAVGADHVLIADASDTGNLKKALISDFASAGGDMSAATYDPTTIAGDTFDMDNMVEGSTTKILTDTERSAISTNNSKQTNVTTDLSLGTITSTTMDVNSSDGTNATLISADTDDAGLLTATKFDEIVANTSKETNVITNLSAGTLTATTIAVNSSDGTNATLVEADTTNAGILGSDKWDEIVANSVHTAGDGSDHADVVSNTSASHTQGTDTTLGTMTEDIDMGNSFQVVNLQAPAASGEAIRQTTNVTEANLNTLTGGGDTTLHDHDGISENTAARHTQNTDTALGSGAVAADHGTASTDQIINVSYGTSATPPTASTTTEGSLYVQYTS